MILFIWLDHIIYYHCLPLFANQLVLNLNRLNLTYLDAFVLTQFHLIIQAQQQPGAAGGGGTFLPRRSFLPPVSRGRSRHASIVQAGGRRSKVNRYYYCWTDVWHAHIMTLFDWDCQTDVWQFFDVIIRANSIVRLVHPMPTYVPTYQLTLFFFPPPQFVIYVYLYL